MTCNYVRVVHERLKWDIYVLNFVVDWELIIESQVLATQYNTRLRYYNVNSKFTDDSKYVDMIILVSIT
jgi:hypothetical protein